MKGPFTGMRAWLVQRVSAVYLFLFVVFALAEFADAPSQWSYAAWRDWVLAPWVSVAVLLFFTALLLHAWVGLRDVILDYVHPTATRIVLLGSFAIAEIAVGASVLQAIVHG